jgi:uncharacterized protein YfaS (alpha-2-macroglobulin family)
MVPPVTPPHQPSMNYTRLWREVDSLEKSGLPRSARDLVKSIRSQSLESGDQLHYVKSLLYDNKFALELEEGGLEAAIPRMESELPNLDAPARQILHSYLGELYTSYYVQHQWQLRQRKPQQVRPDDVALMSGPDLMAVADEHYLRSITPDSAMHTSLDSFQLLLTSSGQGLRAEGNLYQLLVSRALDHFEQTHYGLPEARSIFSLNREDFFLPAQQYVNLTLNFSDSTDRRYTTFRIYQQALKNSADRVYFDLRRLAYFHQNGSIYSKDSLYESAIKYLINSNLSENDQAEVNYHLASFYFRQDRLTEAHTLCLAIQEQYAGESLGVLQCRQLLQQMEAPSLQVRIEKVNIPGQPVLTLIEYKNLERVFYRLVKLQESERDRFERRSYEDQLPYLLERDVLEESQVELQGSTDFRSHSTEVRIKSLTPGYYLLIVSSSPAYDAGKDGITVTGFHVSNLATSTFAFQGRSDLLCFDRTTGIPIKGITVSWYQQRYDGRLRQQIRTKVDESQTDEQGYAAVPEIRGAYSPVLISDSDTLDYRDFFVSHYGWNRRQVESLEVKYFLDRSIYRPGQILFFKGLLLHRDDQGIPRVIANRSAEISLYNTNNQLVSTLPVISNNYGSFTGSFVLPEEGLLGQMSLGTNLTQERQYFQVEAYKRPTFEVKIDSFRNAKKLGDDITVKGEVISYAGAPLGNIGVRYRVIRRASYPFFHFYSRFPGPPASEREITSGAIETEKDGRYTFSFTALSDDLIEDRFRPVFNFEILVEATDISGESQSSTNSLSLGDQPYGLRMEAGNIMDMSKSTILIFNALNADGEKVDVTGVVTFILLDETQEWTRPRYWPIPDQPGLPIDIYRDSLPWYSVPGRDTEETGRDMGRVTLTSFDRKLMADFRALNLPPGRYQVKVQSQDRRGVNIESEFKVQLVDPAGNYVPQDEMLYLLTETREYQPGDTCTITMGAASEGSSWYRIERPDGVGEINWQTIRNWEHLKIPVEESDRGGFFVHFQMTYQNRIVTRSIPVAVPWSDKELDIKILTLREVTKPQTREQVELLITRDGVGLPATELLATMYDASLDVIYSHEWPKSFFPIRHSQVHRMTPGFEISHVHLYYWGWNPEPVEIPATSQPQLNWFGFPLQQYFNLATDAIRSKEVQAPPLAEEAAESQLGQDLTQEDSPVREDFNENVFFYPQLITNTEGKIRFEYVMNDALTTWRLMLFAHNGELVHGYREARIVSQKELMITSNRPRFLRSGDEISFTAKIDNLTSEPQSGKVKLELKNAFSGESVYFIQTVQELEFSLESRSSTQAQWTLQIPDTFHFPVEYTIRAITEKHQDAERAVIPILENRILVTATRALEVPGKGSAFIELEDILKSGSEVAVREQIVFDFTANPAWFAVKALPYLMEYPYECSEQIFNRLFANALGIRLLRDNPVIGKVFDQWRSVNLESPLLKDEGLKSAAIEETPWVENALSESMQMKRLALYFQPNTLRNSQIISLQKLQNQQGQDGGFPWFPGGPSNWFISQYIVEGLIEMQTWVEPDLKDRIAEIIERGMVYLDEQFLQYYQEIEKRVKAGGTSRNDHHLSPIIINYLKIRRLYAGPSSEILDKPTAYFLEQAISYWTRQSLYSQATLVYVFDQYQKPDVRDQLLKSLKERMILNPTLGAFWKYESGFRWWQLPIETHVRMIEVFSRFNPEPELVLQLKRWLLNHKRTNQWSTTKSTSEAIRALTLGADNWLVTPQPLEIRIGDKILDPDEVTEAGSLQQRVAFRGKAIDDLVRLSIKNPNENPAWGAVYYQYFEQLDRIQSDESDALNVVKRTFLETNTDKGVQLEPLGSVSLSPGDVVVVQLEIETDRDMEFIHVKDLRGAALEPIQVLSGYYWIGGLGYYQSNTDLATHYFIDNLPKGRYVLQYALRVSQQGEFSAGHCTVQCMYAPEFGAHTGGERFTVQSIP